MPELDLDDFLNRFEQWAGRREPRPEAVPSPKTIHQLGQPNDDAEFQSALSAHRVQLFSPDA